MAFSIHPGDRVMRFAKLAFTMLACIPAAVAQTNELPLDKIKLPPGFTIEVVARAPNAREMALGANGTLFVGSSQAAKVYAIKLKPGGLGTVTTIASGLRSPVGVAFRG